ncbi:MAG: hypothetical protein Q8K30_00860 [Candidatus Gracilibacteria bacterium]|nr:hypothetical protein [Candidatus Gracilibacteria bacterium]
MSNESYEKNVDDKFFAIGVNATNDINPCQKLEFLDSNKEIVQLDAFELFFKNPEKAKFIYASIFDDISKLLNDTDSTKFSIFSHTTNIADIRAGNTIDFIINIELKQGDDEISYNLGKLSTKDEIEEKLEKKGHNDIKIDFKTYGLEGIMNGMDDLGYVNLFNSGIGGGTHNIASSVVAFSESIKSKWFKVVAPNLLDETNKYISRTSLFLQTEDGNKYCIRTDASESQLKIVSEIIESNKIFIGDILVTDKKSLHSKTARKHSVPTIFSENVLHDVLTVVFNCEDREMGEVILAVIKEVKDFLRDNNVSYRIKTYVENGLKSLEKLRDMLNESNLNQYSLENSQFEKGFKKQITKLDILKEIIITLTELTKITEKKFNKPHSDFDIGRVVIITDGADGSVGSIESYNHSILFTNSIWNTNGEYEKRLFSILNKLSKGQIDLNVSDTTGCGDSSTAAAIMIRESNGMKIRKERFIEVFKELGLTDEHYNRSLAITETYFLSHFQEVISGVVYHCKKSNLGDIPHSDKIDKLILSYVFNNTLKFIREALNIFIYSHNKSDIIDRNIYNGFNIYSIKESFIDLK